MIEKGGYINNHNGGGISQGITVTAHKKCLLFSMPNLSTLF
jgi:hypothetical protein